MKHFLLFIALLLATTLHANAQSTTLQTCGGIIVTPSDMGLWAEQWRGEGCKDLTFHFDGTYWLGFGHRIGVTTMATLGPNGGGTAANDATVGTETWSNINNALSGADSDATASIFIGSGNPSVITKYLKITNFAPLPAGATLNSVTVRVRRAYSGNFGSTGIYIIDSAVRLVNSGTIGSVNKADTSTHWPSSNAFAYATYVFSGADLEGMTAAQFNDSTSGFVISATLYDPFDSESGTARIEYADITADYTAAGGGGSVIGVSQMTGGFRELGIGQ